MTVIALLIAICFSGPWTGTPSRGASENDGNHGPVKLSWPR